MVPVKVLAEAPAISLCSVFNATAPANHLPTELVIKILTSGAWGHWWELVTLTHICQHWRNVALGTPELWMEAARSGLKARTSLFGSKSHLPVFSFLPTMLTRSGPCPLKMELPFPSTLTELMIRHRPALSPHLSRPCHLSVDVQYPGDISAVLRTVRSHIPTLEVLHLLHSNRPQGTAPIFLDNVPSWKDSDLPHLHTLTIPGLCFTRAIAVASLRTLVLADGPQSHGIFLDALDRCSLTLESLTLDRWAHPDRALATNVPAPTPRAVQLPKLRRLKIEVRTRRPDCTCPPALLFSGLVLPSTVKIHIDWGWNQGNTCQLLPSHLIGLHAPPFIDSMCLHLFDPPTASIYCYVGDIEYLSVRQQPTLDPDHTDGRSLAKFLDEHRYPTITQLAIDLDIYLDATLDECTSIGQEDRLPAFVAAFPNLRRLDLLGKNIGGNIKLEMVKAFLDIAPPHTAALWAGKTLGYVCEAPARCKISESNTVGFVDDLRAELDALAAHLAAGGLRLHRLELCIAYPPHHRALPYRNPSPPAPPLAYPCLHDVPPSAELTSCLSSAYLARFAALVDEVIFVGDVTRRGPGYRVLTGAARQVVSIAPKCLSRGSTGMAGRLGRKGR
ncbi:hypothetical protein V8D89_002085 [Ganoderma adspersum]